MTGATRDPAALADRIASVASSRKAIDIRLIDLRGIVSYTDFFVICSGNTERQTKAIHDAIYEDLKHDPDRLLPGAPKATATPAGSCSTTGTSWCTSSHRMRASTTAWRTSGARRRHGRWADPFRPAACEHAFVLSTNHKGAMRVSISELAALGSMQMGRVRS